MSLPCIFIFLLLISSKWLCKVCYNKSYEFNQVFSYIDVNLYKQVQTSNISVMRENSIHFGLKLFGEAVTFKRITKFKQKCFFTQNMV